MKKILFTALIAGLFLAGCIKETYDMEKVSGKASFSPSFGLSVAHGTISLSDLIEPNDTVVFDPDNFVRIVFREDSIIDLQMADLYDLTEMVSFSESYQIGELMIAPFSGSANFPVNEISQHFTPPVTYTNGSYPGFPAFSAIDIGEKAFTAFPNFEYATFSAGSIDITIHNNLPVTIYGLTIRVFNTVGHTQIGNDITITSIAPGSSGTGYLDLSGRTITNSLTAGVTINGSPGTSSPVSINLVQTNLGIDVTGRDLTVSSGRVILPEQSISSLDNNDTIDFDAGQDIEIDIIRILSGNISYTINDNTPLSAELTLTMPTSERSGIPVSETFSVNAGSVTTGNINMNNTTIDLGTVSAQPYNKLPLEYAISVSSQNGMVTFDSDNEVSLEMTLSDPEFDYIKGYFGQEGETIDPDSIDLEIDDILKNITGTFLVSNPSIRLDYDNSFAIPLEIDLDVKGYRGSQTVDLGLAPQTLSYPSAPAQRDISATFEVDRNNSELPELISLPPEIVKYSGGVTMNPQGNTGARDNYIFGNSRFLGSLEVEVPLEFRINNLHFADTLDNFFETDDDDDSPLKPEDIKYAKIIINAVNGFPLGVGVKMTLHDSVTGADLAYIEADQLLSPAQTDAGGKVTQPVESESLLEITDAFWKKTDLADEIIISFTLNTTDNGTKDVKIYSDYDIEFRVSVLVKPEFKFE